MIQPTQTPHTCVMYYRGLRENAGKPFELYVCSICGRESWQHYTGTRDTVEGYDTS